MSTCLDTRGMVDAFQMHRRRSNEVEQWWRSMECTRYRQAWNLVGHSSAARTVAVHGIDEHQCVRNRNDWPSLSELEL